MVCSTAGVETLPIQAAPVNALPLRTDSLEPLDAQGQPLLGDDGRPLTATEFLEDLRVHPVYGFLFQQRGAMGGPAAVSYGTGTVGTNGELINPQAMSAAELYRAGFTPKTASRMK